MLYIAFVCIFLSIFLFTYNKNHLSKKKKNDSHNCIIVISTSCAVFNMRYHYLSYLFCVQRLSTIFTLLQHVNLLKFLKSNVEKMSASILLLCTILLFKYNFKLLMPEQFSCTYDRIKLQYKNKTKICIATIMIDRSNFIHIAHDI